MKIPIKNLLVILPIFLISFDLVSENHTVKMLNQGAGGVMVFEPAVLKINLGDTWRQPARTQTD